MTTVSNYAPESFEPQGADQKPVRSTLVKVIVGVSVAIAALILASAALAAGLFAFGAPQTEVDQTVQLSETSGGACAEKADASLCFDQRDGVMYLEASGLKPGSTVTVESSAGSVNFTVDPDGTLQSEIGGEIVNSNFTATGTWANGDPTSLGIELTD